MPFPVILHHLQTEWRNTERFKNEWQVERNVLLARIAVLEGSELHMDRMKIDLTRRIRMLEYALKLERCA